MTRRTEQMGVLFADISDSTYFYETFGDDRARQIVLNCLELVAEVVAAHGGRVVDRIGDELMCTFPSADQTARASVEIQEELNKARYSDRLPYEISIRLGFHFGPVVLDGDSIFGETVYIAKRVSRVAKARQIMTTGETLDSLADRSGHASKFLETATLKGKSQKFDLHEIIWNDPSATWQGLGDVKPLVAECELHLQHEHRKTTLTQARPTFSIGRDKRCDLVVDDKGVSRVHARIRYRKGYFVLVDESSNGTSIIDENGDFVRVHRDELRLSGKGKIGVGTNPGGGISFQCRTKLAEEQ